MTGRRYRIVTVILDEAVSFEEAMATVRAIRLIRGVDEVHVNEAPGELEPSGPVPAQSDPAYALEP